jgi:hypothetical protein
VQYALRNRSAIAFGRRLGLNLTNKSLGEAEAMIFDVIRREFQGITYLGSPTPKQIELAGKFQRNISDVSRALGDAVMTDLMTDLNLQSIERESLP